MKLNVSYTYREKVNARTMLALGVLTYYVVDNLSVTYSQFSSVSQLLSRVQFSATPCTAARQASLSITDLQSLLTLMSIESVMPSNHLILCSCPSQYVVPLDARFCIHGFNQLHITQWCKKFVDTAKNSHLSRTTQFKCVIQRGQIYVYLICIYVYILYIYSIHICI